MNIAQNKSWHVTVDDDKIEFGVFTTQVTLAGFTTQCVVPKNLYGVRKTLLIKNISPIDTSNPNANVAYWGGDSVSPTTGIPLLPGDNVALDFTGKKRIDIYMCGASGVVVALAEFV